MTDKWWLRLLPYIRPHTRGIVAIGLLVLITIVLNVLKPWPLKIIIDSVLDDQPYSEDFQWLASFFSDSSAQAQLSWLAGGTVFLFVLSKLIDAVKNYIQTGVSSRMAYRLGTEIFDGLQRLSLRFHNGQSNGDLLRRVSKDAHCIRSLVFEFFFGLATSVITLLAMFAIMWQLDPILSMIAIIAAPFIAILIFVFAGPMEKRAYEYQQLEGQLMGRAEQVLSALPIVKSFNREKYETDRYRKLNKRTLKAYLGTIRTQLNFEVSVNSVTAISTAVLMGIGGLHVLRGQLTVGGLVVFLAYLASLHAPMQTLAYLSNGFASAAANARRVFEVLDEDDLIVEAKNAVELNRQTRPDDNHIEFRNVTFGYNADIPVLNNISLNIRPTQTIALVGESGSGKSTLVSLIPRLFDPWDGSISINGVDIKSVTLESLRNQVAVLFQEPFLLPMTVSENIAYARPQATLEEIKAAAVSAEAFKFIENLPDGFDTVIGERGATLSGGEKQRLAIARAFLKDAPILILDEPTSALDASTESHLFNTLDELIVGRTTIIIAHRLSTVRRADRIIVFNKEGMIVEDGAHDELVAFDGLYARFNSLQRYYDERVAG